MLMIRSQNNQKVAKLLQFIKHISNIEKITSNLLYLIFVKVFAVSLKWFCYIEKPWLLADYLEFLSWTHFSTVFSKCDLLKDYVLSMMTQHAYLFVKQMSSPLGVIHKPCKQIFGNIWPPPFVLVDHFTK